MNSSNLRLVAIIAFALALLACQNTADDTNNTPPDQATIVPTQQSQEENTKLAELNEENNAPPTPNTNAEQSHGTDSLTPTADSDSNIIPSLTPTAEIRSSPTPQITKNDDERLETPDAISIVEIEPTPMPLTDTADPAAITSTSSAPHVSAMGQVAFTVDNTLYVQSSSNDQLIEVGPEFAIGGWAEQAEYLLIFETGESDCVLDDSYAYYSENCSLEDFYIWDATEMELIDVGIQLTSVIELYRLAKTSSPELSPDGTKFIFHEFTESIDLKSHVADWRTKEIKTIWRRHVTFTYWGQGLQNQPILVVPNRCGTGCGHLNLFDYQTGQIVTQLEHYHALGYEAATRESPVVYLVGGGEDYRAINRLDLATFTLETITHVPTDTINLYGMGEAVSPKISPLGTYHAWEFGENRWVMFDSDGVPYGTQENAVILDWRRDGGPVLAQQTEDGRIQLVYWPPDSSKSSRVFVLPSDFVFTSGRWDQQGNHFAYIANDNNKNASYLYLWNPQDGTPKLIYATSLTNGLKNITWHPNGQRVFFNQGVELWEYQLETDQAYIITP